MSKDEIDVFFLHLLLLFSHSSFLFCCCVVVVLCFSFLVVLQAGGLE